MSTTPTPASTTAGTFLGREPLLWTAAIRSSLWALVIMEVITLTDVQLGSVMLALEAILYLLTRTQATPNVSVVERTTNGGDVIVAGHANEVVPAGAVIRRVGDEVVAPQLATLEAVAEPQRVQIEVVTPQQAASGILRYPQTDEEQ